VAASSVDRMLKARSLEGMSRQELATRLLETEEIVLQLIDRVQRIERRQRRFAKRHAGSCSESLEPDFGSVEPIQLQDVLAAAPKSEENAALRHAELLRLHPEVFAS
jgi:hypothetical protein